MTKARTVPVPGPFMQIAKLLVLTLTLLGASGCSPQSPPATSSTEPEATPSTPAAEAVANVPSAALAEPEPVAAGTVTVSAAASTKEVLEKLIETFHASTGIDVRLNPGPSSGLANQIIAGAPADLFLSASRKWSDAVADAGLALEQTPLLTNKLVIVVPEANPGNVNSPQDLLSDKVMKIALAGEQVPAGMYADQTLSKLNLLEPLNAAGKIVRGQDVRVTTSYVERGEAEAGIVYSTDVRAASGLRIVHEFDPALHDEIVYVLMRLKSTPENEAAAKLCAYLVSAEADPVYTEFGFQRRETAVVQGAVRSTP